MKKWLLLSLCIFTPFVGHASQAADEAAIRGKTKSYAAAFQQRNVKALAQHWAEDATYTTPEGEELHGRQEIEKEFRDMFMEIGNPKIELTIDSITFKDDNTAIEKGTARVTRGLKPPTESVYTATHVKRNGDWYIQSVDEIEVEIAPTHYQELQKLEWMIGNWIDEDESVSIETVCSWDKHKNFITRHFTVSVQGQDEFEGRQIIGWDAANKQIRSWVFDSDGGFGEGTWNFEDGRWVVNVSSTLPNGSKASAVNIYKKVDDNHFKWQSIGREIDGEILPNVDEVTIIRKKPKNEG